ncbi:hypothetical protein Tco_0863289 [Tanacetum coccineum]
MHGVQVQLDMGELKQSWECKSGQARQIKVALDEEQLLFLAGGQDNDVDEDVDEQLVHNLALSVDNVF